MTPYSPPYTLYTCIQYTYSHRERGEGSSLTKLGRRAYTANILILTELNKKILIILLTWLIWSIEMTICELTRPSRCSPTSKLRTHSSTRWSMTRQTSRSSKIGGRSRSAISIRYRRILLRKITRATKKLWLSPDPYRYERIRYEEIQYQGDGGFSHLFY